MSGQTISQYYETDHDRLDELFRNFQALKRTDFARAKEYFKEFKFGLQRHIIWEEEILFPAFEQKTGLTNGGPTEVMRREHRLIGQYLENIHAKVKEGDPESDIDDQMLLNTLFLHNQKEERILYPAIDRSLDDAEHKDVFTKMGSTPEERYAQCCAPVKSERDQAAGR
jgi:iron-sulfur cluster repair protein YtfE (RIC family)